MNKTTNYVFVGSNGDEIPVKDAQLMSLLDDASNTIEILDGNEVSETVDELTGLFAQCYHVKIHYIHNGHDSELWDGFVSVDVITDIFNAEYSLREH